MPGVDGPGTILFLTPCYINNLLSPHHLLSPKQKKVHWYEDEYLGIEMSGDRKFNFYDTQTVPVNQLLNQHVAHS